MLRRLVAFLCLSALLLAKTPRPLANVYVHNPDLSVIDLKKFRGKALVVVIFSTTCSDCGAVLQLMDGIQQEYGPQLQVVGAAGDDNAKFMIGAYVARYRPRFPVGFISKDEIIKLADIPKDKRPVAPIVLFIDRWGYVREQFQGDHAIFKDAQRSLKSLSLAMIKIAPVVPAAPKTAPPPQP
jgi:hypothetical protein